MKALLRFFTTDFNSYRNCHRVNADSDGLGGKIRRGTYRQGGEVMVDVRSWISRRFTLYM